MLPDFCSFSLIADRGDPGLVDQLAEYYRALSKLAGVEHKYASAAVEHLQEAAASQGSIGGRSRRQKRGDDDPSIFKPDTIVAARVGAKADGYILATVISYNKLKGKYEVEDADPESTEDDRKRHFVPPKHVLRLPAETELIDSEYLKGTMVLAMFPQTTTFYPAIVHSVSRKRKNTEYNLRFEGDVNDQIRRVSAHYVVAAPWLTRGASP
jgi:hypothetical protein